MATDNAHYDGGLLLVDEAGCLQHEVLWINAVLTENRYVDAFQNAPDGAPGELRLFRQFADEVVLDG